jgi:hypothetical protein
MVNCLVWSCRLLPAKDCPYMHDMWVTNTNKYIPFETLVSRGKHATQSSTLGTGMFRTCVRIHTTCLHSCIHIQPHRKTYVDVDKTRKHIRHRYLLCVCVCVCVCCVCGRHGMRPMVIRVYVLFEFTHVHMYTCIHVSAYVYMYLRMPTQGRST